MSCLLATLVLFSVLSTSVLAFQPHRFSALSASVRQQSRSDVSRISNVRYNNKQEDATYSYHRLFSDGERKITRDKEGEFFESEVRFVRIITTRSLPVEFERGRWLYPSEGRGVSTLTLRDQVNSCVAASFNNP
jgi:hypothetical protein